MEMSAPQQAVLFIVDNENTVAYGGGITAIEGKTSWKGEMNEQQKEKYKSLLNATGWLARTPASDESTGTGHYNINIRTSDTNVKFRVPLTDRKATEFYDFFMSVADSRLEEHLRKLPKPNVDVISDRTSRQSN
jgi:hypothetical protein